MDLNETLRVTDAWSIKGELTLSCNCEVFCPCVLSLGQSAPTEGTCLTWADHAIVPTRGLWRAGTDGVRIVT